MIITSLFTCNITVSLLLITTNAMSLVYICSMNWKNKNMARHFLGDRCQTPKKINKGRAKINTNKKTLGGVGK